MGLLSDLDVQLVRECPAPFIGSSILCTLEGGKNSVPLLLCFFMGRQQDRQDRVNSVDHVCNEGITEAVPLR